MWHFPLASRKKSSENYRLLLTVIKVAEQNNKPHQLSVIECGWCEIINSNSARPNNLRTWARKIPLIKWNYTEKMVCIEAYTLIIRIPLLSTILIQFEIASTKPLCERNWWAENAKWTKQMGRRPQWMTSLRSTTNMKINDGFMTLCAFIQNSYAFCRL